MLVLLFPGQGSHTARDADVARSYAPDLVDLAEELIGEDPFDRIADSTRFAQPALFITSVARRRAVTLKAPAAAFAGHSLGEFAALVVAGALSPEEGLELVVERGRLMSEATAGAMVALRGDASHAAEIAGTRADWVVANDNAPGQVVISGPESTVDEILAAASDRAVPGMRLPVTGAFHSPLMAPAAAAFAERLAGVDFTLPSAPVYCCATAEPFVDPRRQLAEALTSPVRWRELLLAVEAAGATHLMDVGPGKVIDGLSRRTLPGLTRLQVEPDVLV